MQVLTLFATGLGSGLLAGGASCAAVQGGLLAGAVTPRAHRPCDDGAGCGTAPPPGPLSRALAAFLGAKLLVHTLLGGVLGLAGAAAQPTPAVRAVLLLLAGALMALFGLGMLGLPGAGRLLPRHHSARSSPPGSPHSSRRGPARGPFLLGAATVLVPCGVTLGAELVAVTSGSALGGAAVMAGFVLGTVPLFALLGWVVGASSRVLRGALSRVVGVLVVALAAWTILSGLRVGGWWTPPVSGATDTGGVSIGDDGVQRVEVTVRDEGYHPARVQARAGLPTLLILRTKDTRGCTRALVIPSRNVQRILPPTGSTAFDLGSPGPGALTWTCSMGMYGGRVEFRDAR